MGNGYAQFKPGGERTAHRFAYMTQHGPIPAGHVIDHTCHNDADCTAVESCLHRRCCNPRHLEAVPQRTNLLRGNTLVALNALKTHCPQGHEYSDTNTYTDNAGSRHCRECTRIRNRAADARRRAARRRNKATAGASPNG